MRHAAERFGCAVVTASTAVRLPLSGRMIRSIHPGGPRIRWDPTAGRAAASRSADGTTPGADVTAGGIQLTGGGSDIRARQEIPGMNDQTLIRPIHRAVEPLRGLIPEGTRRSKAGRLSATPPAEGVCMSIRSGLVALAFAPHG